MALNIMVADLRADRIRELQDEINALLSAEAQAEKLEEEFGGEVRWRKVAKKIDEWGRENLPWRVFESLSATYEGVMCMHRMMVGSGSYPCEALSEPLTEQSIRKMMRDPRYWRDRDPEIVKLVREWFRKLHRNGD